MSGQSFEQDSLGRPFPAAGSVTAHAIGADSIAGHTAWKGLVEKACNIIFADGERQGHGLTEPRGREAPAECRDGNLDLDEHEASDQMSSRYLLEGTLEGLEIRSGNQECQKGDEREGSKETQQGQMVRLPSFENGLSKSYTQKTIRRTSMPTKPRLRNGCRIGPRSLAPC